MTQGDPAPFKQLVRQPGGGEIDASAPQGMGLSYPEAVASFHLHIAGQALAGFEDQPEQIQTTALMVALQGVSGAINELRRDTMTETPVEVKYLALGQLGLNQASLQDEVRRHHVPYLGRGWYEGPTKDELGTDKVLEQAQTDFESALGVHRITIEQQVRAKQEQLEHQFRLRMRVGNEQTMTFNGYIDRASLEDVERWTHPALNPEQMSRALEGLVQTAEWRIQQEKDTYALLSGESSLHYVFATFNLLRDGLETGHPLLPELDVAEVTLRADVGLGLGQKSFSRGQAVANAEAALAAYGRLETVGSPSAEVQASILTIREQYCNALKQIIARPNQYPKGADDFDELGTKLAEQERLIAASAKDPTLPQSQDELT